MINQLILKFGRFPGAEPLSVPTTPITVFVGPNNSGKSKALREIHEFCTSGQRNISNVILDSLTFNPFSDARIAERIDHVTLHPRSNETIQPGHLIVGKRGQRFNLLRQQLVTAMKEVDTQTNLFCSWYLAYNTLILDGANRINLVNQQPAGDLQQPAHSSFQVLFRDDVKRAEVRRIIHEAFDAYFVIDPTNIGQLRLRLSNRAPDNLMEERGLHDEAVRFHAEALGIDHTSDGVKAFVGMITEIVAGDPVIVLIDEPEAFLHPALAFTLGKEIAYASSGLEKRLFVSTHSPTFVMGCIQSGAPINIVRLTYRNQVATARILPSESLLTLMRNPLLRSTGVISALFYEHVIVTESDTDRAFYQEINERLLRFQPDLGIPNCLFINAQNKQTVQTIIRPLRELGIPAAGIVDLDVLKEGGAVWSGFMDGGFVPDIDKQAHATARATIKQRFDATGREMKTAGGVDLLGPNDREAAFNLFDQLDDYGLHVVRRGEVESWLSHLGVNGHGPAWLISIFEKMGENPDAVDFVRPTDSDVWKFIGKIKGWLTDPRRKGIPT